MTSITEEACLALQAKGEAEKNLARLALCPPWRHAAFAALLAALVSAPTFAVPIRFGILALVFVAIAVIMRSDRRRLGVFINGYRRGKTRMVTFPMLAATLGLYAGSFYAGDVLHRPSICLALAAMAFGVGYAGSVVWQRVFVRELGV